MSDVPKSFSRPKRIVYTREELLKIKENLFKVENRNLKEGG
ncbi:hypothetical protein OAG24_00445 [bacterium]|nr:hypothetical protein [bacterium]